MSFDVIWTMDANTVPELGLFFVACLFTVATWLMAARFWSRLRAENRRPTRQVRAVPQPPTYTRGVAQPEPYWPWSQDGTTALMPIVGSAR